MIWHKKFEIEQLKTAFSTKLFETLGIEFLEIGDDFLTLKLDVTDLHHQPFGILNGGISCLLAESAGSMASNLVIDQQEFYAAGLDINANHLKPVKSGEILAKATPFHLGRGTHVWEVKVTQGESLICISRLTTIVLEKKHG